MRDFEGQTLLTLKEASEKYLVPTYWLRRQLGKAVLPQGQVLRYVKFPSDRNVYIFDVEVEVLSKPVVYSSEPDELSQIEDE